MNIREFRPVFPNGKSVYIETYGCQMNSNDSEVVVSIMKQHGYTYTTKIVDADVILINTCSIRDNAEIRIWGRLKEFRRYKKSNKGLVIGVIGCMAERLREDLIKREKFVDIVVGPDAYRSLPLLISKASIKEKGINVELSIEETYDDIAPVRLDKNGVTAFVAIMRGCNNMCSYCVVPYTRGAERSRDPETILGEVKDLIANGYKEVTLLGQNVNSYGWKEVDNDTDFPDLLAKVADLSPELRVRFSTSHPKDISDKLIETVASRRNICKSIHLPAQSGSSSMLERMNRKYTREWYLDRIKKIKELMPECTISTDIIAGFCGETLEEHQETLSLMREVEYEFAYMYKYSLRPNTKASRTMVDDVSEEEKSRRLTEVIELQGKLSLLSNKRDVGKVFEVLAETVSKRSSEQLSGRTSQNKVLIFNKGSHKAGDYVNVKVTSCTPATLIGVEVI